MLIDEVDPIIVVDKIAGRVQRVFASKTVFRDVNRGMGGIVRINLSKNVVQTLRVDIPIPVGRRNIRVLDKFRYALHAEGRRSLFAGRVVLGTIFTCIGLYELRLIVIDAEVVVETNSRLHLIVISVFY